MKLLVFGAATTLLGAVLVLACGDDRPPGESEVGPTKTFDGDAGLPSNIVDSGTGDADAASSADASDAGPLIIDCTTTTQDGPIAQEIDRAGDPPQALGGDLAPGSYQLTTVYGYFAADPDAGEDSPTEVLTDNYAQKTLELLPTGAYHFIEASGTNPDGTVGSPTLSGGTWAVAGTNLVLTSTCAPPSKSMTLSYYASGANIYLYRASAPGESVATRQEVYVFHP